LYTITLVNNGLFPLVKVLIVYNPYTTTGSRK